MSIIRVMSVVQSDWSSKPNLSGFDDAAREIVSEAIDLGWKARLGSKGHLVLRAPDGETTHAVSRDLSDRRTRLNTYRPIKRWRKEMGNMSAVEAAELVCDVCGWEGPSDKAVKMHKVSSHSKPRVCPYPECNGREFGTPGSYGGHMKAHERKLLENQGPVEVVREVVNELPTFSASKPAALPSAPENMTQITPKRNGRDVDVSKLSDDELSDRASEAFAILAEMTKRYQHVATSLSLLKDTFTTISNS